MKRKLLALPFLLCMLFSMPAQAAETTYKTEVQNNISLGQVAIDLSEYQLDKDGKEIPYANPRKIIPGETVSKIVRIKNLGNDAWIRVKAEYTAEEGINGFTDENLQLSGDKWERHGDYYYYKEPVKSGNSVDFIKAVTIPEEWGNIYADKTLSINITSEAVQERNFTPDFTSDDPWFGTLIEERVYEPFTNDPGSKDPFSVEFRGGAEGLVRVGDDFFHNFGTALPGDTLTDEAEIRNEYGRPVHIYFHTETIDPNNEFLKQLHLTIKNGSTTIFDDTMDKAVDENHMIDLGEYEKGNSSKLNFSIYVPKELTNKYALSNTKTKWIFTAKLKEYNYHKTSGGGGGSYTPKETVPEDSTVIIPPTESTPNETVVVPKNPDHPKNTPLAKTGDTNMYIYGVIFIVLAGGVIIYFEKSNKKDKSDKKEGADKDEKNK